MAVGRWLIASLLACAALTAPYAEAKKAPKPWPPAKGKGLFFVHFAEEHWNDDDSDITLIQTVEDAARYRPDLVTMSGDKANDGTVEQLTRWEQIMSTFDKAGVPYLPGIGNHDRTSPPGVLPGTAGLLTPGIQGSLTNYRDIFADRPYPFGDAAPYDGIGPSRPAGDPTGASSHYYADIGRVRWIFIDNSCWGIADCDSVQNPGFPDSEGIAGQFEFLEAKAQEASNAGRFAFVVMHMPTRDPRDQSQVESTSFNHVMGKGLSPTGSPDNGTFEVVAERSGVDGVFTGHIKGQWLYSARGVPYYIDGGAGGELYTNKPLGTDHGYWHGYRLVRVRGDTITTDVVPILKRGSISIAGPDKLRRGNAARFEATGRQVKKIGRTIELELRDPNPTPRSRSGGPLDQLAAAVTGDEFLILAPAALLAALLALQSLGPARRRLAVIGPATALVSLGGLGAIALAQQGIPTNTPKSSLPNPARIWTTANRFVLAPVSSSSDDARRNRRTQTHDGTFRAKCPGVERLFVTSGFEKASKKVRVPSRRGAIVKSLAVRGRRAQVRLKQRAEVIARVKRGKKVVRKLGRGCFRRGKVRFRWNGRIKRGGKLKAAPPGRYRLQVLVDSDRKTIRRSGKVRIR